jgi:hemoglobin
LRAAKQHRQARTKSTCNRAALRLFTCEGRAFSKMLFDAGRLSRTMRSGDEMETLYGILGGADGLARIVFSFHDRVQRSERLGPYFARLDLSRLVSHHAKLISFVLTGPGSCTDDQQRAWHAHLRIDDRAFDEIVDLLAETLREFDLPHESCGSALARMQSRRLASVGKAQRALDGSREHRDGARRRASTRCRISRKAVPRPLSAGSHGVGAEDCCARRPMATRSGARSTGGAALRMLDEEPAREGTPAHSSTAQLMSAALARSDNELIA